MKDRFAKRRKSRSQERLAYIAIQDLAWFRYELRKFLGFSERAAKSQGLTPQQHQLLLGIAGFNATRRATISELAEFLQERHNSVVELVGRAMRNGLVRKKQDPRDRRFVYVSLTPRGETMLSRLTKLHRDEVERLRSGLLGSRGHGSVPRQ